jgi:N-methylhydantoinase B
VVRVFTTGGGGWGDPLERETELVERDVIEGKVSLAAARDDYGVVLTPASGTDSFLIDEAATAALRAKLRTQRREDRPMIDRGQGYERMLRGEVVPWTRSA